MNKKRNNERVAQNKLFKKLFEEILRRINGKHCNYNITGIEIKLRRNQRLMTLAELAEDICSISYLCKVEQSQIKPSLMSLNDICVKLGISDETLEALMSLEGALKDLVRAYFEKDSQTIQKIYQSGIGLENYRYKIIQYVYNVFEKEHEKASEIGRSLINLTNVLSEEDLTVFSVFYTIENFNFLDGKEIYKELECILKMPTLDDSIVYLIKILKVKCLFVMNSSLLIKEIEELSNEFLKIARFDLIEDIRYIEALYFLFNKEFDAFDNIKKILSLKLYIKNLDLYEKFIKNEKINNKDLVGVGDFAFALGTAKNDLDKALEFIGQSKECNDYVEFDSSMIEYSSLKGADEKYNFIAFNVLPSLKLSNNKLVANYYKEELKELTKETNKYKLYFQFCMEMNV